MPEFIIANSAGDYQVAAMLFKEYVVWLNIDLGFQHFDEELQQLTEMYAAPDGAIILCKHEKELIGCVAIRKTDNSKAELKRMFVRPAWQGRGIGKMLLDKAIDFARKANYSYVRLDTLNYMLPAINLYRQYGFYEIPAYYNNPNPTAVYFEIKC